MKSKRRTIKTMMMNRLPAIFRLRTLGLHLPARVLGATAMATAKMSSSATPVISADQWWSQHKRVKILDGEMSYYDSDPKQEKSKGTAVFLHGNPTSSYLWRHVIPRVEGTARCLAPDLIGMGRSSKLENSMYTYDDHYRYLSSWFNSLNLQDKITIVCHDWGSGLGIHWIYQNQSKVKSLVYMEALIGAFENLDDLPEEARDAFRSLRSDAGEEMVLKQNMFVEQILPSFMLRILDPVEMDAYREPFKEEGESRRPTLTWPRNVPFRDTGPQNVVGIIDTYTNWLAKSTNLPKMYIDGEPGALSPNIRQRTNGWPNQKTVNVKGLHFLQEDSPVEIGDAVKDFILSI